MAENRIKQLLQLHKAGELSEAEQTEWRLILQSEESSQLLRQLMEEEMLRLKPSGDFDMHPWQSIFQRIVDIDQPKIPETTSLPAARVYRIRTWTRVAAAVLIVLAGAAYFILSEKSTVTKTVATSTMPEIGPAKAGAVLTLADGRQVALDSIGDGIIAMESGAQVMLKSGRLEYAQTSSDSKDLQYNTMTTPRGRQFRVMLPDGTEAWLNAESSIRFPLEFSHLERKVEITGEVFFHVKSMTLPAFGNRPPVKVPFVVKANKRVDIEVLGTQFNVAAYANEKNINTTLTEGVVRVRTNGNAGDPSQQTVLMPGQQAIVSQKGSSNISVKNADIEKALAWRNGLFNFEDISLADAMLQLERWYDINVVYEDKIPDIWFSGKMSRDITLPGLLKILERTGVNFRLEGRTLIVLSKKN